MAGDDDQTIYSFTGAQPEAILHPDIPDDHKIILKQSYRVPRAVHALAENTIRQVTVRQEKVYLPRPEDGRVSKLASRQLQFRRVRDPEERRGAHRAGPEHHVSGALLLHAEAAHPGLRKSGIPFHNPYRNRMGSGIHCGLAGADRHPTESWHCSSRIRHSVSITARGPKATWRSGLDG